MPKLISESMLNAVPVDEGRWVDAGRFRTPFSITIFGFATGDAVQVYVSNLPGQPTLGPPMPGDGTVAYALSDTNPVTADTVIPINHPVRWVRCRKSASSGTQSTRAELCAVRMK